MSLARASKKLLLTLGSRKVETGKTNENLGLFPGLIFLPIINYELGGGGGGISLGWSV